MIKRTLLQCIFVFFIFLMFFQGNILSQNHHGMKFLFKIHSTAFNTIKMKSIFTSVSKDELLGKFEPSSHKSFISIDAKYTSKKNIYLRKECYDAFIKMHNAAKKDNINLIIVSATRNFSSQKYIWESKWNGNRYVEGKNLSKSITDPVKRAKKILEYSSMPGTSRHHWGTDIDINSVSNNYFETKEGSEVYQWLRTNAHQYGFCQPYTQKGAERPSGYEEEPWHWTYTPLSKPYLEAYINQVEYDDIKGFDGWATAEKIDVVKFYVLGIHSSCK